MPRAKQEAVAERAEQPSATDDKLYTITMIEPQYNHLYGRLEPGDEIDMDYKAAQRWVGLKIAESDDISFDETKVPGRVRKIHPYEEPAASGPQANPQVAALQAQVEELTRLVRSQLGGGGAPQESAPRRSVAQERAGARQQEAPPPPGKVDVPNPVTPDTSGTTEPQTFAEAAANAKDAEKNS